MNRNQQSKEYRPFILVREREWESTVYTDLFWVHERVSNPEEALRQSAQEFLSTPEGKEAIEESCHDFNWGDFVNEVPDETLENYGIRRGDGVETVHVQQDELLIPEDEEIEEEEDVEILKRLAAYSTYIEHANETGAYQTGWNPVCYTEFVKNDLPFLLEELESENLKSEDIYGKPEVLMYLKKSIPNRPWIMIGKYAQYINLCNDYTLYELNDWNWYPFGIVKFLTQGADQTLITIKQLTDTLQG